jgi:hypothetical protein
VRGREQPLAYAPVLEAGLATRADWPVVLMVLRVLEGQELCALLRAVCAQSEARKNVELSSVIDAGAIPLL